jgi:hypothetical protein
MGEVVFLDTAVRRSPSPPACPREQVPETYVAYRQAEEAFRAFYFGRPFDLEAIKNRPSTRKVEQHWSTVEQLAGAILRDKSLSREQAMKLLLRASLETAVGAVS